MAQLPTPSDSTHVSNISPRDRNPFSWSTKAARQDEVALMAEAVSICSEPGSSISATEVLKSGLRNAVHHGSIHVIDYCLSHGADVNKIYAYDVASADFDAEFSEPVVKLLMSYGWDIKNQQSDTDWPLIWYLVDKPESLIWLIDHGSDMLTRREREEARPYDHDYRGPGYCPSLLERAAEEGSVSSFELLRSHGAPLSPRILHVAALACTRHGTTDICNQSVGLQQEPKGQFEETGKLRERMDMVRHIVTVLKINVNALDRETGGLQLYCHGTPLCYVGGNRGGPRLKEVTEYLLDCGADPDCPDCNGQTAMDRAAVWKKQSFIDIVRAWKSRTAHWITC